LNSTSASPDLRAQAVADDQVVEHRGAVEQRRGLERARHAQAGDLVRAQSARPALESDLPMSARACQRSG
jgi:hypothetical protein